MRAETQARLERASRIIDRVQRWHVLAKSSIEEALEEEEDDTEVDVDDATYPGSRTTREKSRYQLSPGHGQNLSDLLSKSAELVAANKIASLLNG